MGDALDALAALADDALDEARAQWVAAERAAVEARSRSKAAEHALAAFDADVRRALTSTEDSFDLRVLAQRDVFARARRLERGTFVVALERAREVSDEADRDLERATHALGAARASREALERRLEARAAAARQKAIEREEEEAEERAARKRA